MRSVIIKKIGGSMVDFMDQFKDLGVRFHTMKKALELYSVGKRGEGIIVETGTTRMANDWGAGMSTVVFGAWCKQYGGKTITVDLSPQNIETCKEITKDYSDTIEYVVSDSLFFFTQFKSSIDLLYLDSFDYPYGELLDLYGGREDIDEAAKKLRSMTTDEIIEKHFTIINPSQEHQLKELKLALPLLHEKSVILLDDNELPGGGKTRLTREYLQSIGWVEVLCAQQSLWIH